MAYRNILIAVDGSNQADQVVKAGLELINHKDKPAVSIVNVVTPITQVYGDILGAPIISSTDLSEEKIFAQAKARLIELAQRHGVDENNVHIELGSTAPQIRKLADKLDCDLIVIGTHGQHGLGLMLGSTAHAVLHGVNQNVLVVRLPK